MFTDLKSGDYLNWHIDRRQQDRTQMVNFLQRGTGGAENVIPIIDVDSDATVMDAAYSVYRHEYCRILSEKSDDIVELIRNARIRMDRYLPFIRRKVSGTGPQFNQVRTALETFIAGMAHHFNNLFMAIQGNVSLILMASGEDYPILNLLKRIEKLVQGESMLTNDLLGFALLRGCRISGRRQAQMLKEILAISDYIGPVKDSSGIEVQNLQLPDLRGYTLRRLTGGIVCVLNRILSEILEHTKKILALMDVGHPDHERVQRIERYLQTGFSYLCNLFDYAGYHHKEVKHRVDLMQLAETALDIHFRTYADIPFHAALDCDLKAIKADRRQIESVLQNLFDNAADALPVGGKIFLSARNVNHHAIFEKNWNAPPGNYVIINFEDTGQGIDEPILKRIFEPFFTTKGMNSHCGLGLSSACGILRSLSGYISVCSGPQSGTVFKIYLPADGKSAGTKRSGVRSLSDNKVIHLGVNKRRQMVKYH